MPAFDKSVVKKALADTEDPTPGYLFRDISQMTFHDGTSQDKLVAYLFEKLDVKNSVHVLAKALNVIKHLCKEGHADFQKTMQRRSDELKPFASYRGPSDPKYGDKLNEKVRNYAREAIDAAFSHRKEQQTMNLTGAGSDPIATSKAASSAAAAAQAASQSGGGFLTGGKVNEGGSAAQSIPGATDRCAPMPTSNKWAEHMASQQAKAGGAGFGFVDRASKAVQDKFGWEQGVQSKEQRMMAELNAGPGGFQAVDLPGQFGGAGAGASGAGGAGGGWKFVQDSGAGGAPGAGGAHGAPQKKVQTPVEAAVEKLATSRSVPQRVELSQFLAGAQQLIAGSGGSHSWEELAAAMDTFISTKNQWQHRLNTLAAVEHILRASSNPDAGPIGADFKEYFTENPEDIQRNVVVVQEALKERAQKVLKLLGVPDRTQVAAQQAQAKSKAQAEAAAAAQAATAQSTMAGTTNWSAAMPPPAGGEDTSNSGGGGGGGFLDGMTVKSGGGRGGASSASSAPKEQGDKTKLKRRGPMSMEQFEAGQQQQQPAPQQQTQTSDWGASAGGWGDSGGSWPTAQPSTAAAPAQQQQQQQAPPPKKSSGVDLDDLFGGGSSAPAAAPKPAAPSNNSSSAGSPVDPFATAPAPPAPAAPAPAPAAPAPAPAAGADDAKAQIAAQAQQQLQLLMQQSMAAMQRGDTATAQMLMQQQQQLMAQLNAMMGK